MTSYNNRNINASKLACTLMVHDAKIELCEPRTQYVTQTNSCLFLSAHPLCSKHANSPTRLKPKRS